MKKDRQDKMSENFLLHAKVLISGGHTFENKDSKLPTEIENQFLRNVLAFEEAPLQKLSDLLDFHPKDWPNENVISNDDLCEKLDILSDILAEHHIVIVLQDNLPDRMAYKYLIEDYIPNEKIEMIEGMTMNINGCDGFCKGCFQLEWCETGQEMLRENKQ